MGRFIRFGHEDCANALSFNVDHLASLRSMIIDHA